MLTHIRPYSPGDLNRLLYIFDLNTPQYFDPSERAGFENYLRTAEGDNFIVESGAKLLGCGGVCYESDGSTAVFAWAMIHPDHHGKGLGRQLCEYRLQRIRSQPHLKWVIVRTSQLTDGFYRKMGFQLKKVEKDYWAKGYDLYYMVMEL